MKYNICGLIKFAEIGFQQIEANASDVVIWCAKN
jgi:hypothetical protein